MYGPKDLFSYAGRFEIGVPAAVFLRFPDDWCFSVVLVDKPTLWDDARVCQFNK